MELTKINKALDNYFAGNSSTEEESLLRAYFSSENVDPSLQQYKPLFAFYTEAKSTKSPQKISVVKVKKIHTNWITTAAAITALLGIGSYALFQYNGNNDQAVSELGTYDDPELAFKETQKALAMLSTHVNTGVEGMQYMKEFEKTKNKIFNPLIKN